MAYSSVLELESRAQRGAVDTMSSTLELKLPTRGTRSTSSITTLEDEAIGEFVQM